MPRFILPFAVLLPLAALADTIASDPGEAAGAARLLLQLVLEGRWQGLAIVGPALVLLVYLARRYGARWVPWLATPPGGVLLSVLGGFGGALATALAAGEAITPGLLGRAVEVALVASGAWGWRPSRLLRPPSAQRICTASEIANGTCSPSSGG